MLKTPASLRKESSAFSLEQQVEPIAKSCYHSMESS